MSLIPQAKQSFNTEFKKIAKANIIRKLKKQGINPNDLNITEFNDLVTDEIAILRHDSKRVAAGIAIGIVIAAMTGGI